MSVTSILFVCIGNTCRSPMAEAIARSEGGDRIAAYSAGLSPTGHIAPEVKRALQGLGYPTNDLSSKSLEAVPLHQMDVIVSLIGRSGLSSLPSNLGATLEEWSIRDPYGEDEQVYHWVAQTLQVKVKKLLDELDRPELSLL